MNKVFGLILILVLINSLVYADSRRPAPAVDGINYFPQKNTQVQETGLTYFHFGRSITSYSDSSNVTNFFGSLGHRRYADSLIYGTEYSYHFSLDKVRYQDFDILVGYRPNLNYRVSPYIIGGAGLSFASGSSAENPAGNGINYYLDVGADLFSIDVKDFNFKFMSGLKLTHETLTGGSDNNRVFTDMYIGVGFGW